MKMILFAFLTLLVGMLNASTQVDLGVSGSVDAPAKLKVDASSKGFLPMRVSRTSTTNVIAILSPYTGLIVYKLATAGAFPGNVPPETYYFVGSARTLPSGKWSIQVTMFVNPIHDYNNQDRKVVWVNAGFSTSTLSNTDIPVGYGDGPTQVSTNAGSISST